MAGIGRSEWGTAVPKAIGVKPGAHCERCMVSSSPGYLLHHEQVRESAALPRQIPWCHRANVGACIADVTIVYCHCYCESSSSEGALFMYLNVVSWVVGTGVDTNGRLEYANAGIWRGCRR